MPDLPRSVGYWFPPRDTSRRMTACICGRNARILLVHCGVFPAARRGQPMSAEDVVNVPCQVDGILQGPEIVGVGFRPRSGGVFLECPQGMRQPTVSAILDKGENRGFALEIRAVLRQAVDVGCAPDSNLVSAVDGCGAFASRNQFVDVDEVGFWQETDSTQSTRRQVTSAVDGYSASSVEEPVSLFI